MVRAGPPASAPCSQMIAAVCFARTYGEDRMISGRSRRGKAANQRPAATACSSPSADSGTSTSRMSMSISCEPAWSAASRATLPWLCPCRTSHSRSGQFCRVVCFTIREKASALRLCQDHFESGGSGQGLRRLPQGPLALIHAPEGRERLADDLVHIVIAVGREAADEGDALGRIGERLVTLVERLVLFARDRIVRIA